MTWLRENVVDSRHGKPSLCLSYMYIVPTVGTGDCTFYHKQRYMDSATVVLRCARHERRFRCRDILRFVARCDRQKPEAAARSGKRNISELGTTKRC